MYLLRRCRCLLSGCTSSSWQHSTNQLASILIEVFDPRHPISIYLIKRCSRWNDRPAHLDWSCGIRSSPWSYRGMSKLSQAGQGAQTLISQLGLYSVSRPTCSNLQDALVFNMRCHYHYHLTIGYQCRVACRKRIWPACCGLYFLATTHICISNEGTVC